MDASENETTKYVTFLQDHWYRIRMPRHRRRQNRSLDRSGKTCGSSLPAGKRNIAAARRMIREPKPFGIACWQTTAALRQIKLRHVDQPADKPKKY